MDLGLQNRPTCLPSKSSSLLEFSCQDHKGSNNNVKSLKIEHEITVRLVHSMIPFKHHLLQTKRRGETKIQPRIASKSPIKRHLVPSRGKKSFQVTLPAHKTDLKNSASRGRHNWCSNSILLVPWSSWGFVPCHPAPVMLSKPWEHQHSHRV